MIQVQSFVFNPFQENTFILFDETKEAIIVDAGCFTSNEENMLNSYLAEYKLKPVKTVNTHCHVDHIVGVNYVKNTFNIPFFASKPEEYFVASSVQQAAMFGLNLDKPPKIDSYITEGDTVGFGNSSLKVISVPGHSAGSIALYAEEEQFIIVGDVLFDGSIGRTDLPGGDYGTLINSIKNKLMTLPGNVRVFPGHGPVTTIKKEYDTNPFLN